MKYLKRIATLLGVLLLLCTQTAFAQQETFTRDQKMLYPFLGSAGCTGTSVGGINAMSSKEVWILGDSITYGARDKYKEQFEAKQIATTISGVASRSWTTPGEPNKGAVGEEGSGAEVVAREKEKAAKNDASDPSKLKSAGAIVIAFGSNGFGSQNPIDDAITKIREVNASAPIYWVNLAFKELYVDKADAFNAELTTASPGKFTIIDWHSVVYTGEAGIDGSLLGDYVHPSPSGYTKLGELVANSVSTGSATTPQAAQTGCTCGGTNTSGQVTLSPNTEENAKTIFQFFVGKGLTAEQAAGILGNMEHESGFNPRRVEGTKTPEEDSDTPDHRGYGIVQFTPGTKIVPAAEAANRKPSDLAFQLDFIWEQFMSNEGAAYEDLKSQTTVEGAARSFGLKYERYRADLEPVTQPKRNESALNWYNKLKGLGGTTASCGSQQAQPGQSGEHPEGFVEYLQTDPQWKDIPYGGYTLERAGCGPTTLAMIISSINKDPTITPASIVQEIDANGIAHTTESVDAFTAIPAKHGLRTTTYGAGQFDAAYEQLKNGPRGEVYMIANVGVGYWTQRGHYLLLTGVGDDGKVSVKDTIIRDPPVDNKTYDPEFFKTSGGSDKTNAYSFMVVSK